MLEQQDFDTYDISIISHRLKSAAGDFTEKNRKKGTKKLVKSQLSFFLGLKYVSLFLEQKIKISLCLKLFYSFGSNYYDLKPKIILK